MMLFFSCYLENNVQCPLSRSLSNMQRFSLGRFKQRNNTHIHVMQPQLDKDLQYLKGSTCSWFIISRRWTWSIFLWTLVTGLVVQMEEVKRVASTVYMWGCVCVCVGTSTLLCTLLWCRSTSSGAGINSRLHRKSAANRCPQLIHSLSFKL